MHLNVESRFGEVTVEVLDPGGEAVLLKSEAIRVDGLDVPVAWGEGGLDAAEGSVTLRITLRNARLYALWCTE